jgi:hypothetical protein
MMRAKNSIESQSIFGLQTVLGKGSQLGSYTGFLGSQIISRQTRSIRESDRGRHLARANTYLTSNRSYDVHAATG